MEALEARLSYLQGLADRDQAELAALRVKRGDLAQRQDSFAAFVEAKRVYEKSARAGEIVSLCVCGRLWCFCFATSFTTTVAVCVSTYRRTVGRLARRDACPVGRNGCWCSCCC